MAPSSNAGRGFGSARHKVLKVPMAFEDMVVSIPAPKIAPEVIETFRERRRQPRPEPAISTPKQATILDAILKRKVEEIRGNDWIAQHHPPKRREDFRGNDSNAEQRIALDNHTPA